MEIYLLNQGVFVKNTFMKKHYPIIIRICLSVILALGITMPISAKAIDIENLSWLNIFGIKKNSVLSGEQSTSDLSDQLLTVGMTALLQVNSPIGIKYVSIAPYCAYNPKTSYCLATVTAYSSTVDQTDSSPFITANGSFVKDGIVACNFLPFGTKVKFPDVYGNKVFSVEDRMAKKNNGKVDIWFPSTQDAREFGVQRLRIEILN